MSKKYFFFRMASLNIIRLHYRLIFTGTSCPGLDAARYIPWLGRGLEVVGVEEAQGRLRHGLFLGPTGEGLATPPTSTTQKNSIANHL